MTMPLILYIVIVNTKHLLLVYYCQQHQDSHAQTPSYRIACEQLCLHSRPSPSFPSLAVQLSILQAPSFLSLAVQLSILQATGSWVRAWEQGYCLIIWALQKLEYVSINIGVDVAVPRLCEYEIVTTKQYNEAT